ncbi:MAG: hypothetical protein H6Q74_2988 [Firmicutes bacterium]|nr:hypothetical protein [Bacillota bacterium]
MRDIVLIEKEKKKSYSKYFYRPYPEVPEDILEKMSKPMDLALAMHIDDRNDLLNPRYLPGEVGYCIMPDGSGHVASLTRMPGVTLDMIDWWFAWHGIESLRYKIWDPKDHYLARVTPEHLKRRLDTALSWKERSWNTSDFVLENVGEGTSALRISFRSPESFGFDMKRFNSKAVTAICAHSGPPNWDVPRTVFVHFAREVEGGVELRTRFWLGWMIVNGKAVRTDFNVDVNRVRGLSKHSPQEYYRLAAILPSLYAENHLQKDLFEDFVTMNFDC